MYFLLYLNFYVDLKQIGALLMSLLRFLLLSILGTLSSCGFATLGAASSPAGFSLQSTMMSWLQGLVCKGICWMSKLLFFVSFATCWSVLLLSLQNNRSASCKHFRFPPLL